MESFLSLASSILFICTIIVCPTCWFGAVFSMFKAAANRKPGVPYFAAFNWIQTSLLNRHVYLDDLFNEEGAKHAKRSVYLMLIFVSMIVGTLFVDQMAKHLFE